MIVRVRRAKSGLSKYLRDGKKVEAWISGKETGLQY